MFSKCRFAGSINLKSSIHFEHLTNLLKYETPRSSRYLRKVAKKTIQKRNKTKQNQTKGIEFQFYFIFKKTIVWKTQKR